MKVNTILNWVTLHLKSREQNSQSRLQRQNRVNILFIKPILQMERMNSKLSTVNK